jgi:uncharacterized protein (TIGR03032 family)
MNTDLITDRIVDNTSSANKNTLVEAKSEATYSTAPTEAGIDSASVEYSISNGFVPRMGRLGFSVAFTSYQSNFLYLLGRDHKGGAHIHQSAMPKPMGLCKDGAGGLVLSAGSEVLHFANILKPGEYVNHTFDACYLARTVHVTGTLDAHDVGVESNGRIVFVNTRFNCLATVSPRHSFEMLWKPDFISALVDEDRCHLNGLAMEDGEMAYVTAASRSNTIDGWRDRRFDGGVVIDVRRNKIICEGLSMPHSPRLFNGKLWVLDAGSGYLGVVNRPQSGMGCFEPLVFCPGFLRGLAFHDRYAFVGLSKPRYKRFEGLALDENLKSADSEPWCGVQVIDLERGTCVDWFRIDGDLGELYDVEIIPDVVCPMTVSPYTSDAASLITYEA